MMTPRTLGAVQFKAFMIFFKGKYAGILESYSHYISLKVNFLILMRCWYYNDEEKGINITEKEYKLNCLRSLKIFKLIKDSAIKIKKALREDKISTVNLKFVKMNTKIFIYLVIRLFWAISW